MSKLFLHTIVMIHAAPRDSKESIVTHIITDSEDKIYSYIDKQLLGGIWSDHHNDSLSQPLKHNDEDGNFISFETFQQKMMRIRGSYFDPFADFSDKYYGVTHYGWTEPISITQEQQQVLIALKVAIVL